MKFSFIANGAELLRRDFDAEPTEEGWVLFFETPKPALAENQQAVESAPELSDGKVSQRWEIVDTTPKEPARVTPIIGVPQEIPLFAFRIALDELGLLGSVLAFIDAIPDPKMKKAALTHLEYGNFITRSHPLLLAFSAQYGLTQSQVDDIFRVAEELRDGVADFGEVATGPAKSYERTLWERVKTFTSDLLKP